MPVAQVLEQRLAGRVSRLFLHPERVCDRPRDEPRLGDAAQLDEHRVCPLPIETGRLERQARLARSGCTRQREEPHVLPTQESPELAKLTRPPHEGRRATFRGRLGSPSTVCPRVGGGEIERGILVENRALELPERERGFDAERLHERASRIAIRRERVRLPSRAIESEHELGAEALTEWVPAHQQLELGDELGIAAEGEIHLDPFLEGLEPKLLEPRDLGLRPRLVGELDQRLSSPERKRLPQQPARLDRGRGPRVTDELLETEQIERPGIGMELVRRGDGPDQVAAERPAELRDVGLEHLRCRGRRPAGPDLLDQAIARDRLVRPKKEDDEQRAGLARTQRHDAAV